MTNQSPIPDIKVLLGAVFDDIKPNVDMTQSVMSRLAMITTAIEFGRLVSMAPLDPVIHGDIKKGAQDDEK